MVTVSTYKLELENNPKPSLMAPKLACIWQISFSHILFWHVLILKDHLYQLDFTKRVTTYFSPEYQSYS